MYQQSYAQLRFAIPKLTKDLYSEWKHHVDGTIFLSGCQDFIKTDVKFEDICGDPSKLVLFVHACDNK
jgi:hypothetical protein